MLDPSTDHASKHLDRTVAQDWVVQGRLAGRPATVIRADIATSRKSDRQSVRVRHGPNGAAPDGGRCVAGGSAGDHGQD